MIVLGVQPQEVVQILIVLTSPLARVRSMVATQLGILQDTARNMVVQTHHLVKIPGTGIVEALGIILVIVQIQDVMIVLLTALLLGTEIALQLGTHKDIAITVLVQTNLLANTGMDSVVLLGTHKVIAVIAVVIMTRLLVLVLQMVIVILLGMFKVIAQILLHWAVQIIQMLLIATPTLMDMAVMRVG